MLTELSIHDLALLEEVSLGFGPALNVVTGETGAGKSLMVGALELLFGERPKGEPAGWVRKGKERARVEGRFVVEDAELRERVGAWLAEHLPALAEDWEEDSGETCELILGRTLTRDGRTRAHVNHRPVSLKNLRGLAAQLFEIHGQNDHQRLLEPAEQLRLVDAFGGLEDRVSDYREKREVWRKLADRVERLDKERAERRDRLEFLRFQAEELERAGLEEGEKERLAAERGVLRHAGDLIGELGDLVGELHERDGAALETLRHAGRILDRWRTDVPAVGPATEELLEATVHLEESVSALTSFIETLEADPARLEVVEERLVEIERLEHKHGVRGDDLIARTASIAEEIESLESGERDSANLIHELARARGAMADRAGALSKARRSLRAKLARAVTSTLAELGLARARFELLVEPRAAESLPSPNAAETDDPELDRRRFGPRGADAVEFQLAANPGEPTRPLRQVASGGEAARIMLGLRTVLAACDRGRTLVFDEVDAGVGGRLGPEVGGRLAELGRHHQVLCVTHLPAIAALAENHLRVQKSTRAGRTRTTIVELSADARVDEIADMIAGGAKEATARAEARRLLASRTPGD